MSAVSWAAVLGASASFITALAVLFAVLGIHRPIKEVQQAVKTANGETVGERIDRIGDLAEIAAAVKPWDGVERRKTPRG